MNVSTLGSPASECMRVVSAGTSKVICESAISTYHRTCWRVQNQTSLLVGRHSADYHKHQHSHLWVRMPVRWTGRNCLLSAPATPISTLLGTSHSSFSTTLTAECC